MANANVLVIGAGSIGRRHAHNLRACGARVTVTDPAQEQAAKVDADEQIPFTGQVPDGYDGVVIAAPTSEHRVLLESALATDAAVLVEKPIIADLDVVDVRPALAPHARRVMVGYNLRLHPPIERLMSLVHGGHVGQPVAARFWFGSWLPDWRPGVDYRESYSARAALGGGVLLDAIHELDLALWLSAGGSLDVRAAVVARLGPLEIDVEDTVAALLVHESGYPIQVSLDYLSRRYRRGIEVIGTDATVRLDWARGTLEVEDARGTSTEPADAAVGASYEREAAHFLALVRGEAEPVVDALAGLASVELAAAIRAAAR